MLASIAGRGGGLGSVMVTAWDLQRRNPSMRPDAYRVPVQGSPNSPFPYFASDVEPW